MAMAIVAASSARISMPRWARVKLSQQRLCWWLALLSVVAVLGQQVIRSSALTPSHDAFDGFGDELEEDDLDAEEAPIVVPPPIVRRPGFDNERGPPVSDPVPAAEVKQEAAAAGGEAAAEESADQKLLRHEYWDEDEFEGLPAEEQEEQKASASSTAAETNVTPPPRRAPAGPQSYYMEAFSIVFLAAYLVNYFIGKKANEKIALAWAAQYASKGSIFERNFSLLGVGEGDDAALLMKEGQNVFKFYASGRRCCQGLLATMDLKNRHDLIACIWNLVIPRRDELTIDVLMNDESMDHIVLAVAKRKGVKSMHKEWSDLQQFGTILSAPVQRKWVPEELGVISESREVASDLLTDTVLELVLGEKAFEKHGSNFVSLHFSDMFPVGSHKKVLQFRFSLPAIDRMGDLSRLTQAVVYFIDTVGRYRLSPQARAKTEAPRKKIEQQALKEAISARQEALARKREEKRKVEDADASKLTAEAIRKREDKERMKQLKKAMPRIRVSRAH